ncbi:bis(5'-adenosyl)-triphosphatase enpp4-like [Brevipalpus obovatus]|uniref:bis(5'-adenosyl)-triphosphatase enpp4-like n=1 Tax=Brevipalpus obovatus TaxID=246614 RepID=UPI003D9E2A6F
MNRRLLAITSVGVSLMVLTTIVIILVFVIGEFSDTQSSRPLILISLDGFRPDYLNAKNTPHLWKLKNAGCFGKMIPVFPSETFPNHLSIATGLYPETHGIISNSMYDPVMDDYFERSCCDTRWWDNEYSTPIWIANQIWGKGVSGTIYWPGSASPYKGQKAHYDIAFEKLPKWPEYSQFTQKHMDMVISWLKSPEKPANMIALYITEPDRTAHNYSPFSREVKESVNKVDLLIGIFLMKLRKANLLDNVNLIIVSDHGMAEVQESIPILDLVKTSDYNVPNTSATIIGVWPKDSADYEKIADKFHQVSFKHNFRVYKRDEFPDFYHYRSSHRIAPITLLANEGYELCSACWTKKSTKWGNHGYDNRLPSMRAVFIARGPDFREKFEQTTPFNNVDLYPMMLKLLHIAPQPSYGTNGSLAITDEFLRLGLRPDNQ